MNSGYIKLFRKFKQWEWYNDSKTVHLFIHLLIHANYTDKKWQGIDVKRGQVITGRKQLSADTGISEQSIRTCLERLKATNELTSTSTSKYSIITICNYDKYQCQENEINQQTNQQSTSNQPQLRRKRSKEVKTTTRSNGQHFDRFWQVYPKKNNKKGCLAKWKARKLDKIADTLVNDVKNRLENDRKWREGYITNPLTYINQDRWDDEIEYESGIKQTPEHDEEIKQWEKHRETYHKDLPAINTY